MAHYRFFARAALLLYTLFPLVAQVSTKPEQRESSPTSTRMAAARPKIHPALSVQGDGYVRVLILLREQPHARILDRLERTESARIESARMSFVQTLEQSPFSADHIRQTRAAYDDVLREVRTTALSEIGLQIKPGQDAVESRLVALGARNPRRLTAINVIVAEVPASAIPSLAGDPNIAEVWPDEAARGQLDVSVPALGAPVFWNVGFRGSGESIAVFDSGVAWDHPTFGGRVVSESFISEGTRRGLCFGEQGSTAYDQHGHGTHVAGIAAGAGSAECIGCAGVARGLGALFNIKISYKEKFISGRCDGDAISHLADVVFALEWIAQNLSIKIVNYSYGGTAAADEESDTAARMWDWFADTYGLSVVVSAGNKGIGCPENGCISTPGTAYNVITVANMNDQGTPARADDTISPYSSRGPVTRPLSSGKIPVQRYKPDIAAPGTSIKSAAHAWNDSGLPDYVEQSGTSMAAPHMAGAIAVVRNAGITDALAIKALLLNTADPGPPTHGTWSREQGWGYANLQRLYQQRQNWISDSLGPAEYRFLKGNVSSGGFSATLTWNRHFIGDLEPPWSSSPHLNNLDLGVYRQTGEEVVSSRSIEQNVERAATSATGPLVVKVEADNESIQEGGPPAERFGLALSHPGFTPATGPRLELNCAAPASVATSTQFQIACTARNTGDLAAFATTAAANLPAGFTGSATKILQTLSEGQSANLNWQVTAPSVAGTYRLEVSLASISFDEEFSRSVSLTLNVAPPQCMIALATFPAGRTTLLDGVTYTGPVQVSCGSTHTISTPSPQAGATGVRYDWLSWSDGGARTHTIAAPNSGTSTYTATFDARYLLSVTLTPAAAGWVLPNAAAYWPAGQSVEIKAVADSGYAFVDWTGPVANAKSPVTQVVLNGPRTVTANFAIQPVLTPDLTIMKSHTGEFRRGDNGRTFTITVRNSGNGPTSGPVTVTESIPHGLSVSAMTGAGWNCAVSTLTCTRNDTLAAGNSYPSLVVTVNVASNAPSSVTNSAAVSGGTDSNKTNNTTADVVPIAAPVAAFLSKDTTTKGNWSLNYGRSGGLVAQSEDIAALPVILSRTGTSDLVWARNTADVRAPTHSAGRIAGVWYAPAQMTFQMVPLTSGEPLQVALYFLDWDYRGRSQKVDVLDSGGAIVDTRNVSDFGGGVWMVWSVIGRVQFRITSSAGPNVVLSAIMFGGAVPPAIRVSVSPDAVTLSSGASQQFTATVQNAANSGVTWSISPAAGSITASGVYTAPATVSAQQIVTVTATSKADGATKGTATVTLIPAGQVSQAQFVMDDTGTKGSWIGRFGRDGYLAANFVASNPPYVVPALSGHQSHIWNHITTDQRAVVSPSGGLRSAGAWYTPHQMMIDLPFTGGQSRQIALYSLDWDYLNRVQHLEILNPQGAVLDGRTLSGFGGGVWTVWNVSGPVKLRITRVSGPNAVVSALMFGGGAPATISVSVSPGSATLRAGESQQFTAAVQNTSNTSVTWSISPAAGTIGSSGLYIAPSSIATAQTVTVTATSQADGITKGTATVNLVPAGPAAFARFVEFDSQTRGNWNQRYGLDGYVIVNNASSNPSYVTPGPLEASSHTWSGSTSDPRALLKAGSSGDRIAAVWYSAGAVQVNLPFNDSQEHRVALYSLDWDRLGRVQSIDVLDTTGTVLESRQLNNFGNGVWTVFEVRGPVALRVNRIAGPNAVISGLMFGGAPAPQIGVTVSPATASLRAREGQQFTATVTNTANTTVTWSISPGLGAMSQSGQYVAPWEVLEARTVIVTATSLADGVTKGTATITLIPAGSGGQAQFVGTDTATRGNWRLVYGAGGYLLSHYARSDPPFVTPQFSGGSGHIWSEDWLDERAPLKPSLFDPGRIASTMYSPHQMTVDLRFTDSLTHQLAVYSLDWDNLGRVQTIEVLDNNGAVLDSQFLGNFQGGVWTLWRVSGHVKLRVTRVAGPNAVISALMFDQ